MALFGMCTNNPTVRGKLRHADTKADLIFKRVFCNYLQVVPTDVGHGPVRTLFLSLLLFLPPNPNYNSIAFGKSTSQRIHPEQHTPKIGWKLHKYGLQHALHTLDDHFR